MLNHPTVNKLREMKLKVMAQMLEESDPAWQELSFEERFGLMVDKEWLSRKNARIKRYLHKAALGLNACLEDVDYSTNRTLDKNTIRTLSTCVYIEQKLNIVISGKTGSGKTYLACAFGNQACRQGYITQYYRVPELLLELQEAKREHRYKTFMKKLNHVRLLILDDIGLKTYTLEESRDLLEIAENRYNQASTILAGQMEHSKWYELFPDPTIADAIMDRIIHNSYILTLDSRKSMREVMAEKTIQY